ncbi:TVP38/TMEM64 family protein [Acidaminobacter sp. JC074]|nr:TVP38/TMEM64 family protein [Acidaminobacter sp. JC074]
MKKQTVIKIGLPLAIILLLLVTPLRQDFKEVLGLFSSLDIEVIKTYVLSFGILAPIVSFLLMVFQSLAAPLPAFLITFANASLFGWIKGAILSWSSAMVGAILCFYIARYFGRNVVEKLTSKLALESIDEFFDRYGRYTVLIARLLPFISFDVVSYAAGLTSMSIGSFIWATAIGQLPATLVYSYVGGMLTGGMKHFVFGMLILFALSTLIFLLKKIFNDKSRKGIVNEN